jgi:hypothetical protein
MDENEWAAVARTLQGFDFPAGRQDIINHVRQRDPDGHTVRLVTALPRGVVYRNIVDVREEIARRSGDARS